MDRVAEAADGQPEACGSAEALRGHHNPAPQPEPPATRLQGGSNREEADDYRSVVVILSDDWRVIACRAGIQWILQYRRGQDDRGRPRWHSRSYVRDRAGLLILIRRHAGPFDPGALAVVEALPDWIGIR